MKYTKVLGSLIVAVAALMALAATASATLTSPTGTTLNKGAKIHAANENGHFRLKPENLPAIECPSTMEFEIAANGGTSGKITSLTFGMCTDSWQVTTIEKGELEIEGDGLVGTYNGTVYSKGTTIEAVRFGIPCRYMTTETQKIGSFTGGNPGTIKIEAKIPFHGGSVLCGPGPRELRGDYLTTAALYVDG